MELLWAIEYHGATYSSKLDSGHVPDIFKTLRSGTQWHIGYNSFMLLSI